MAIIVNYKPSIAEFSIRSENGTVTNIPYGNSGEDIPFAGYFDGNENVQVAVYRKREAVFYVRHDDGSTSRIPFGDIGDMPVAILGSPIAGPIGPAGPEGPEGPEGPSGE